MVERDATGGVSDNERATGVGNRECTIPLGDVL